MSRKKTIINPVSADRVKQIIIDEKMPQWKFAESIHSTQQTVSKIVCCKTALTIETAQEINKAFPRYRLAWLMGYDDYMTHEDAVTGYSQESATINNGLHALIVAALNEVCTAESIPVPILSNIPEFLLIESQIKDYVNGLMWNYIKNREHSHVWTFLDKKD